jgi:formate C-acetyltransferase
MDHFLEGALAGIQAAEGAWPRINPSPMVAGTFEHCIARGKDIGQGGPLYNSVGFVGAGLANAADALLALKQAVYDEGRYTMDEVLAALESDYVKQEPLRRYLLNRVPKWGNGDPAADAMGRRVADYYCETVHSFTNGRGGACQAALFTLSAALTMGKRTAALPDGRRAGESLAPGQGASYGRDKAGVTGLIDSIAALDGTATPNGAVVDITLHPSAVEGEAGLEALVALIKTFIARGGYACQFNVYDVDTLRAAQRHPERYASLQIRVTGWSVYWNTLSRLEQDQYIARVTHAL